MNNALMADPPFIWLNPLRPACVQAVEIVGSTTRPTTFATFMIDPRSRARALVVATVFTSNQSTLGE